MGTGGDAVSPITRGTARTHSAPGSWGAIHMLWSENPETASCPALNSGARHAVSSPGLLLHAVSLPNVKAGGAFPGNLGGGPPAGLGRGLRGRRTSGLQPEVAPLRKHLRPSSSPAGRTKPAQPLASAVAAGTHAPRRWEPVLPGLRAAGGRGRGRGPRLPGAVSDWDAAVPGLRGRGRTPDAVHAPAQGRGG